MEEANQIAQAIREMAAVFSNQNGNMLNSVTFWGIAIPTFVGLITFFVSQSISKERFRHDVSMKCINNFREAFKGNKTLNKDNIDVYLGMINEELFYFQKNLIYKELVDEWLQNMINTLPVFYVDDKGIFIAFNENLLEATHSFFSDSENWKYLFPYPNIRKIILINPEDAADKLIVSDDIAKGYRDMAFNNSIKRKIAGIMKQNLYSKN